MPTYKTPDVYVEEISKFPPSVVPVETAIPAFIGYTEKAKKGEDSLQFKPTPVRSLVEYEELFGGAPPVGLNIYLNDENQVNTIEQNAKFYLYDSLRMFFINGGGKCYIISIGSFFSNGTMTTPNKQNFLDGLEKLQKKDEPTIILFPDATLVEAGVSGSSDLYDIQANALMQCDDLKDRFLICDLKKETADDLADFLDKVDEFRNKIGINYLKYGAAYAPWLKTSLPKVVAFRDIKKLYRGQPGSASEINLETLTEDAQIKQIILNLKASVDVVDHFRNLQPLLSGQVKTLNGRFKQLFEAYSVKTSGFKIEDSTIGPAHFNTALPGLYQYVIDIMARIADAKALPNFVGVGLDNVFPAVDLKGILSKLGSHHTALNTASIITPATTGALNLFNTADPVFLKAIALADKAYDQFSKIPADASVPLLYSSLNATLLGVIVERSATNAATASSAANAKIAGKDALQNITAPKIRADFEGLITSLLPNTAAKTTDLAQLATTASTTADANAAMPIEDKVLKAVVMTISIALANNKPTLELGTVASSPVFDAIQNDILLAIDFATKVGSRSETSAGTNKEAVALDIRFALFGQKAALARNAMFEEYEKITSLYNRLTVSAETSEKIFDAALETSYGFYKNLLLKARSELNILPPSGAIAGVYSAVDSDRGVWKAPANFSLNSVSSPTLDINTKEQADLNVDANAGKSINAIRAFTGKGTLVWGARTLAGNDNEWRYINVRRFFNFAEESIKKATEPFVFEPNDANTWAKVKSMIVNFLTLQWRDGALQGAKPDHAFYVKVGLGETMTALDVLEGRLIVEVGMAVVRPAEFIILRFTHKLPES